MCSPRGRIVDDQGPNTLMISCRQEHGPTLRVGTPLTVGSLSTMHTTTQCSYLFAMIASWFASGACRTHADLSLEVPWRSKLFCGSTCWPSALMHDLSVGQDVLRSGITRDFVDVVYSDESEVCITLLLQASNRSCDTVTQPLAMPRLTPRPCSRSETASTVGFVYS